MSYFAVVLDDSAEPLLRVVADKEYPWCKPSVLHVTISLNDASWEPWHAALVGALVPVRVTAIVHSQGVIAAQVTLPPEFWVNTPHVTLAYAPPFRAKDSTKLLSSVDFLRRKQKNATFGEVVISLTACTVYGTMLWMECPTLLPAAKIQLDSTRSSPRVLDGSETPAFTSCVNSDAEIEPETTEVSRIASSKHCY